MQTRRRGRKMETKVNEGQDNILGGWFKFVGVILALSIAALIIIGMFFV